MYTKRFTALVSIVLIQNVTVILSSKQTVPKP